MSAIKEHRVDQVFQGYQDKLAISVRRVLKVKLDGKEYLSLDLKVLRETLADKELQEEMDFQEK